MKSSGEFLNSLQILKLTKEHAVLLEEPVSPEEIKDAIKAPGPDRFTAEFYKKFGTKLLVHLHELFRHYLGKKLQASWKLTKLILLPKQDQNLTVPQ